MIAPFLKNDFYYYIHWVIFCQHADDFYGGRLNPQDTATRAQVAQIFYNSRGLLTSSTILSSTATWVVDVPGHYETVTRLELQEVTVGEIGHWEDGYITEWVYRCNQCGYVGKTVEEISQHIEDSVDWDTMGG